MADSRDIRNKLDQLTKRQCQILYWVCSGKDYAWIAKHLAYSKDLIQLEMTRIYDLFDLHHLSRNDRRFRLFEEVRPIHLGRVTDPNVDCLNSKSRKEKPQPNRSTLALVKEDERAGLIPLGGQIVSDAKEAQMLDRYEGYPPPPDGTDERWKTLTWVSREIRGMDTLSMCRISREKMGINSNS